MSEVAELAGKLRSEGDKFVSFYSGLTSKQWMMDVYTEGSVWTIRNILAHLVTAERAFNKLFPDILAGGPGVAEDFDIDRYNARQQEKARELNPQELLEQYKVVRADMIAWVNGLAESDLEKEGRHPYLGQTTLREMIKMVYLHNQIHYRDLKKVLR